MTITLDHLGKRFSRDWVFRNLSHSFSDTTSCAILGPNGSGKSTLIQLIACYQSPTEGTVTFTNGTPIPVDDVFRHITLCAPYMQLIEEFTLEELVHFHFSFRSPIGGLQPDAIIALLAMQQHSNKQLRHFSSGMKQRVKLCLCLLTDAPVILLDEPATNLDADGIRWYRSLLEGYSPNRILIISSNRPDEYEMCREKIVLSH